MLHGKAARRKPKPPKKTPQNCPGKHKLWVRGWTAELCCNSGGSFSGCLGWLFLFALSVSHKKWGLGDGENSGWGGGEKNVYSKWVVIPGKKQQKHRPTTPGHAILGWASEFGDKVRPAKTGQENLGVPPCTALGGPRHRFYTQGAAGCARGCLSPGVGDPTRLCTPQGTPVVVTPACWTRAGLTPCGAAGRVHGSPSGQGLHPQGSRMGAWVPTLGYWTRTGFAPHGTAGWVHGCPSRIIGSRRGLHPTGRPGGCVGAHPGLLNPDRVCAPRDHRWVHGCPPLGYWIQTGFAPRGMPGWVGAWVPSLGCWIRTGFAPPGMVGWVPGCPPRGARTPTPEWHPFTPPPQSLPSPHRASC